MNCAIELSQMKQKLELFMQESFITDLRLIKGSFQRKWNYVSPYEIEILKQQLCEMESTFCHPEALSWLQQTISASEENRLRSGLKLRSKALL